MIRHFLAKSKSIIISRSAGTEKEEAIDRRLSRANYEIASSDEFDFVLTNHDVDETVKEVFKIIKS